MILFIFLDMLNKSFENFNYKDKQPLIKIFGKSILEWILDYLNIKNFNEIVIVYNNNDNNNEYIIKNIIKKYINKNIKFNIEYYDGNNTNVIDIFLKIINKYINDNNYNINNESILYLDTKYFYLKEFYIKNNNEINNNINKIYYINDKIDDKNNIYINEKTNQNNKDNKSMLYLSEKNNTINKNKISLGSFYLNNFKNIKKILIKLIEFNNILFLDNKLSIIHLINLMLNENIEFKLEEIVKDNIIYLNTPFHIRLFCNNFPRINAYDNSLMISEKKICFEIENILIFFEDEYKCYPIINNINYLNYLKKIGNKIILLTNNKYKNDSLNLYLLNILKEFNINYDEIYFNKLDADYIFLSNSIILDNNIEKNLGFYNNKIDTRDFNDLILVDTKKYKKISENLKGEINYYLNIPCEIKDVFPILYDYDKDGKWFEIENIIGITVSHLYLNEELTTKQLDNILGTILRIHNSTLYNDNNNINYINIYDNYSNKLKKRKNNFNYDIFQNNNTLFDFLIKNLEEYESKKLGKKGIIHGDSVFTNIIINNFGKIKFIDMRGKIGDELSLYGDKLYDYAKIYQSLIGYDEILIDKVISKSYKNKIIEHFKNKFLQLFTETDFYYLKIITGSLLYSLIPLHNNNKCKDYYNLIYSIDIFSNINL